MKKYFILTLAIAGLALVSCQKEKFIENSEAPANEITLKAATVSTRSAINGTTFPDGYGMLVSAYRNSEEGTTAGEGDTSGDYFEGIKFTKGGSSSTVWGGATPKYWPLNGKLDFLCIASAGIADNTKGVVPTCEWGVGSNVAKQVVATVPDNKTMFDDILYGSANAETYDSEGNQVVFKHAECAVVFLAKSTVAYNETTNVGITITDITVNGPKTSGVLTVSNPLAGGGTTGSLSASWDVSSGDTTTALKAKVWNTSNTGNATESALTELHLSNAYTDASANLDAKHFGDAYVIVPPQDAVSFTISYTLHNGKEADGNTNLDRNYTYKREPTTGEKWEMGKKVVYKINITLHGIEIAPEITDWVNDPRPINIE